MIVRRFGAPAKRSRKPGDDALLEARADLLPFAPSSDRARRSLGADPSCAHAVRGIRGTAATVVAENRGRCRDSNTRSASRSVSPRTCSSPSNSVNSCWRRLARRPAKQLVQLLGSELELLKLERSIDEQVRGSIFQNQREFFLQEQLRVIHRELGQEDGDEFEELARQIAARGLPEAVETRAQRELKRIRRSSPTSPDAAVARGWLDWVLALPWNTQTEDTTDLAQAKQYLEEDHFGLDEVKERILDHIAVLARVGTQQGPILCLVGPPVWARRRWVVPSPEL